MTQISHKVGPISGAAQLLVMRRHQDGISALILKLSVGSFSIDDGNGSENVSFKMNSRFFKLCRVHFNLLKMASVGEFPWS